MAAAPPGYRPDIRPRHPRDRPHDQPHPPKMPRVQDAIPSLDCRAWKGRSNPLLLNALRFATESRALFRPAAAAQRRQDGARLKGEVPSWNTTGEAAIIARRASWLSRIGQRWDITSPHESSMGVAGMPLVLAVFRPPRVASVPTRSQILAQEENNAALHGAPGD
jgi:hypothetical protein